MFFNLRKTLRFQIGAIVSVVLAILLVALISMHFVSASYDREVMADKREKLGVISQGISRDMAFFLQAEHGNREIMTYFRERVESIVKSNPHLIIGLYLPKRGLHEIYGGWPSDDRFLLLRQNDHSREEDQFFDIKVSSIRKPLNFVEDGPAGIFLGRAEPIMIKGQINGSVLVAEHVQGELPRFRLIRRIVFNVVPGALILGMISTFWVLARLKRGVRQITTGLQQMEQEPSLRLSPPASEELREIASAINNMADVVEQKTVLEEQLEKSSRLAALGQLVAGVAHEIRNPLGIMKSTVQVMQDEFKADRDLQQYLTVLEEQVERQNKIIRELLDYAKPVPAIFQRADIGDIIKSLLGFSKSYFQQHNVQVDFQVGESPAYVNADVEKLKQAFLNLIFNAVEAMTEGGTLRISISVDGTAVHVEFADNGRGIDEADLNKLFDPFYTTKHTGTGLGLATVHKIIELHQGNVQVESRLGEGTIFAITLPVCDHPGR